ncbi:unnamed protein product, partial [Rotaria sp. Silwood2]
WFIIKDSYIVDKQPGIHEICFPMLIDHDFQVSTGIQRSSYDDDIKINNSLHILFIQCRTAQNRNEWTQYLLNLTEQVKDFVNETRNRFDSYASI